MKKKKYYDHPIFKQYKKNSHQFISFSLYEKKLHERKEKRLKALGLARDMTQSYFGFFWGQDPTQMCSVGQDPT